MGRQCRWHRAGWGECRLSYSEEEQERDKNWLMGARYGREAERARIAVCLRLAGFTDFEEAIE